MYAIRSYYASRTISKYFSPMSVLMKTEFHPSGRITSYNVCYTKLLRLSLNRELLEHFWDPASGGLYFTANDSEALIFRKKEFTDAAIPSGNSVEMLNLLRLSRIIADPELEETADRLERSFSYNFV